MSESHQAGFDPALAGPDAAFGATAADLGVSESYYGYQAPAEQSYYQPSAGSYDSGLPHGYDNHAAAPLGNDPYLDGSVSYGHPVQTEGYPQTGYDALNAPQFSGFPAGPGSHGTAGTPGTEPSGYGYDLPQYDGGVRYQGYPEAYAGGAENGAHDYASQQPYSDPLYDSPAGYAPAYQGVYETAQIAEATSPETAAFEVLGYDHPRHDLPPVHQWAPADHTPAEPADQPWAEPTAVPQPRTDAEAQTGDDSEPDPDADLEPAADEALLIGPHASNRRRKPAGRRSIMRVAIPSMAAVGVAACAAVAVAKPGTDGADDGSGDRTTTAASAEDTASDGEPKVDAKAADPNAPKTPLDSQLAGIRDEVGDFTHRASRTQTRLALKEREKTVKKERETARKRKEAIRPKFALPVTKNVGLSSLFGQSGTHWMSLHTGIDFPVGLGTPVYAATDGTVRSQWGGAYGNMVIVTAPDGTETWYCHLGSATVRSGQVKAGQQIALSGNSGNSTGPHLHFEVHPGGGSAVNPLTWLLSHNLDPR